jgi:hypothetical protein
MRIRRPIAALFTALALFGGGTATLTACGAPTTPEEGTTDDTGEQSGGDGQDGTDQEENLPDNSDPEKGSEDSNDDTQDPD